MEERGIGKDGVMERGVKAQSYNLHGFFDEI